MDGGIEVTYRAINASFRLDVGMRPDRVARDRFTSHKAALAFVDSMITQRGTLVGDEVWQFMSMVDLNMNY